jgi:hypothetical protein
MIGETYPFLSEDYIPETGALYFTFLSQGEQVIPKLIAFTPIEKGGNTFFNWGFGDLIIDESTGEYHIDDKVESNNGDVKTVFYTVVSTLNEFFEVHPNATVYVEGSNQQRMEVYKGLIYRHWKNIEPFYTVKGMISAKIEHFSFGIDFEYLLISRKKL